MVYIQIVNCIFSTLLRHDIHTLATEVMRQIVMKKHTPGFCGRGPTENGFASYKFLYLDGLHVAL